MLEAIHRSVMVPTTRDNAFRAFTEEFGTWWPLKRSPGDEGLADAAHMDARPGGKVRESWDDGRVNEGEILVWEPPHRLVFSWRLGGDESRATEIEVKFAVVRGETRVALEHRGWADALRSFAVTAHERERSRSCSSIPT